MPPSERLLRELPHEGTSAHAGATALTGSVAEPAGCLILGTVSFVLPLLPFRDSMLRGRSTALSALGDRLQRVVDAGVAELPQSSPSTTGQKEIDDLRKLTELVQSEPVWPFDAVTVRKFATALAVPIAGWIFALGPVRQWLGHVVALSLGLSPPQ